MLVQLFENEMLQLGMEPPPNLGGVTSEAINDKYVRGEIRIVTEQARYPLSTIVTMLESGDYNLNPEFQRRHRWDRVKQSRLIESFIMNVPIPPVFLYEVAYSRFEVMDGLQRLTAIADFYRGKFRLTGLDPWHELNGMLYAELPEQVRRGVDRRYLSSIILLRETAKDDSQAQRLKQMVFERINSGGVKLEPQEARNALYNGPLNELCIRLARTSSFCRMWGIPTDEDISNRQAQRTLWEEDVEIFEDEVEADPLIKNVLYQKMQDVELVLRFFAYRQLEAVEQGRLRDFLDEYLRLGNRFPTKVLEQLEELFITTCDLVHAVLGDRALYLLRERKNGGWGWFERPTKVLYDPIMRAFSKLADRRDEVLRHTATIQDQLEIFYKDNASAFAGRSTNQEDIFRRMRLIEDYLKSCIGG
ncbi:MAG: DUF262 domain-containing protein [Alphaproteobacteria bacterium]|nr:DUF262 domain-containing protein [Alphaproteobacteria bacterium]